LLPVITTGSVPPQMTLAETSAFPKKFIIFWKNCIERANQILGQIRPRDSAFRFQIIFQIIDCLNGMGRHIIVNRLRL